MKRTWLKPDLKGKFKLFSLLGIIIWLLNFSIVYFEMNRTNKAIRNLERIEDLYNTILETRRYEKNFLLYHNRESLNASLHYLQQAEDSLLLIAPELGNAKIKFAAQKLGQFLKDYKVALDVLARSGINQDINDSIQNQIRSAGKEMVDISGRLLKAGRKRVGRATQNALYWPLIFMGIILIFIIAGALTLYRKVINPLVQLEKATENIARGDFGPIPQPSRIESQVDRLVLAFNRMVEELEARHEQIIHTRKIASLGTLVSGVAHELNNPINNIILTIDTLCGGRTYTPEKTKELLEDILRQAIRASEVVKNLLDFSRAEISIIQEVDIGKLLKDIIQITSNQITLARVNLIQEIAEDMPHIQGNRQGLQQVFLNLIINAIQAMAESGELAIIAYFKNSEDKIMVKIRDNGIGISEEHLQHIFDPFFTTKEVGKGTGLGLSVSYGIIKKHGGQITVKSRLGKGTTFTVTIPIIEKIINE